MPDALGFLFDMLAARENPYTWAEPLSPLQIATYARRRGVPLPSWDDPACDELEIETAVAVLRTLRTELTDALVGEDPIAGRESLNLALAAWDARLLLEEELAEDDLPGVEVIAGELPPVPLQRWHRGSTDIPGATADRCPHVGAVVLAVASVLLTEATNIHLSGYAHRVRACAASACRRPYLDAGDAGRRRFCSGRCRSAQSARNRADAAQRRPMDSTEKPFITAARRAARSEA